jgi:hypothetical protein
MAGFELDPAEMRAAYDRLLQCRQQLKGYLGQASSLGAVEDGVSLVAVQMRKAYQDRADQDGGVLAVLEDYIAELDDVLDTMGTTLETYEATDAAAADTVHRSARGEVS